MAQRVDITTVVTYTDGDFESVIDAIATGKIQPKGMITKVLEVHQVDEGFKALVDDKDNQVSLTLHRRTGEMVRSEVEMVY